MSRLTWLSSLSASLVALTLGTAAAASPGLVTKIGQFRPQGMVVAASAPPVVLEKAARDVLSEQVASSGSLSFGAARHVALSSGSRVVKLPQTHLGLPVAHRGAAITFTGDSARLVTARLESDLPGDAAPEVTADTAAAIAEGRTGLPVVAEQTTLAFWPTADGVRLVWALGARAIPGIPYQPVTLVDAKTGDILQVYNSVLDLNQSQMFPSNPVKSPALADVTLPVGAGQTVLENELVKALNCVDQKSVKKINFQGFMLDVHTCDLLHTALPDANGDYLIPVPDDTEPEDSFAEVSIFHHANKAYDLFRGWDPALDVNNGVPLAVVSNLRIPQGFQGFDLEKLKDPDLPLTPFQNAFFAPSDPIFSSVFGLSGGALWFGQGPVHDYSYDGDVVYHELTHAVVNVTLKLVGSPHMDEFGASYSPGGMNEGLSDYFSSAITGDGDVGEYASQDFFPGSTAIRSLTNPDSCPTAIGGEVHQDATLFAGSLWDLRVKLEAPEQAKLDEAVFAAMNASATGDLSYDEMANLIITETETLLGAATAQDLTNAFTTRGILPKCSRILEFTGATLTGPKDLQELWFAPGTQTTGAKNSAGDWTPGVVQVHYALPEGTNKLEVTIKEVAVGGGGFGGGTPFVPKFLVRFGADPITFTYKPTNTNPDVVALDGVKNGTKHVLSVDVPPGTTSVYVMVGSTGQADGAYTDLSMVATTVPVTSGAGGMGGDGGAGGAGGAGGQGGGGAAGGQGGNGGTGGGEDVVIEGCGCSLPGTSAPQGAAFAAIAALGLVAARRRRRSR